MGIVCLEPVATCQTQNCPVSATLFEKTFFFANNTRSPLLSFAPEWEIHCRNIESHQWEEGMGVHPPSEKSPRRPHPNHQTLRRHLQRRQSPNAGLRLRDHAHARYGPEKEREP